MYVIRIDSIHREYVSTSSPYWLNLLNDTTNKKEYATKFRTKKEAETFLDKLIFNGRDAGASYDRFKIVRY